MQRQGYLGDSSETKLATPGGSNENDVSDTIISLFLPPAYQVRQEDICFYRCLSVNRGRGMWRHPMVTGPWSFPKGRYPWSLVWSLVLPGEGGTPTSSQDRTGVPPWLEDNREYHDIPSLTPLPPLVPPLPPLSAGQKRECLLYAAEDGKTFFLNSQFICKLIKSVCQFFGDNKELQKRYDHFCQILNFIWTY